MNNLDDIWQEYITRESLNLLTLNDLIWHIENDAKPEDAIVMAIDMIVEESNNMTLKKLIPYLAKQLDHEDDFVREVTVGCIVGRIKLPEYAEKALVMAKNDPYKNVRGLAASSLGAVINKVNFVLSKQIAVYLYDVITDDIYSDLHKQSTYSAILEAMEVPVNTWPPIKTNPDIQKMIDKNLLEKFKIKYNINNDAA